MSAHSSDAISVATYNCLASDFFHYNTGLNQSQQAYGDKSNAFARQSDCINRIRKLNPDIVCLQELSSSVSDAFISAMKTLGYEGHYEQFSNGKPDGVATFYRTSKFKNTYPASNEVLPYNDTTGRKALLSHLTTQNGRNVTIVNTHLQGGQQNLPTAKNQLAALVQKVNQVGMKNPVIICADTNFTPMDDRYKTMRQNNLNDSLNGATNGTSMNGTSALRLDYIWHTNDLKQTYSAVAGDLSKYLTNEEPSDHVPVFATFALPVLSNAVSTPSFLQAPTYYPSNTTNLTSQYSPHSSSYPPSSASYSQVPSHLPTSYSSTASYYPNPQHSSTSINPSFAGTYPSSNSSMYRQNPFPGTDANPSFRRKLYNSFIAYMDQYCFSLERYAPTLIGMITRANEKDMQEKGSFLRELMHEIDTNSGSEPVSMVLRASLSSVLGNQPSSSHSSYPPSSASYSQAPSQQPTSYSSTASYYSNPQLSSVSINPSVAGGYSSSNSYMYRQNPFPGTDANPSFRRKLYNSFITFIEQYHYHSSYEIYAQMLIGMINRANEKDMQTKGSFLPWLLQEIDTNSGNKEVADFFRTSLASVIGNHPTHVSSLSTSANFVPISSNNVETVVTINCKDVPSGQDLYIRGTGPAELSWGKGVKLNRLNAETFEFRTNASSSHGMEFKLVLNDDQSKWEEGDNHKIAFGKQVSISPVFSPSVLPPIPKTTIEVEFPSEIIGQSVSVSGNGPLGNWDRKIPMQPLGNKKWAVVIEGGQASSFFEYKLRLDDKWEISPNNRRAECGKKAELIKGVQFQ